MNWHFLHPAIALSLTLLVGCYPYLQRRTRITGLFALSNISLAICNSADLLLSLKGHHVLKLYLDRLSYVFLTLTVVCFFRFTVEFARVPLEIVEPVWKRIKWVGAILILLSPSALFIREIQEQKDFFIEIPGPGCWLVFVYLFCSLGWALYQLGRQYPRATGNHKMQIRYMLLALYLPMIEAVLYLVSLYFQGLPYFYYYFQVAYTGMVAYTILSHRLMEIHVVIRRTLIYSLTSAALTSLSLFFMILMTRFTMTAFAQQLFVSAALSAIAITFLFHPLLQRIQRGVDQYFPRESLPPALLREATSGFVHEIKRPLANISMPAELALMDLKQMRAEAGAPEGLGKVIERLQYILDQSMEAAQKIEAIRNLWDASAGDREPLDFGALIKHTIQKQALLFEKSAIRLDCSIEEALPAISGDKQQLEIVVINLVKNAREAIETVAGVERTVSLTLKREESQLVLRVRDTGPGIEPDDLPKLFLPYFSTKGAKGMGVGLYIAKEIAQAHGGSLSADSELGKGAEFVLKLPVD